MYRLEPFTPTPILNQTKTIIIPVTDTTLFVEALNRRPIVAGDINRDIYLSFISDYTRWPVSPGGIYFLQVESANGGLLIKREDNGTYRRVAVADPERAQLLELNGNFIQVNSANTLIEQLNAGVVADTCLNVGLMVEKINIFKAEHRPLIVMDIYFKYRVNFEQRERMPVQLVAPTAIPAIPAIPIAASAAPRNAIEAYGDQFLQPQPQIAPIPRPTHVRMDGAAGGAPAHTDVRLSRFGERPTHWRMPAAAVAATHVRMPRLAEDAGWNNAFGINRPPMQALPRMAAPVAQPLVLDMFGSRPIPMVTRHMANERIPDMDLSLFQVVPRDHIIDSTLDEEKSVTWREFAVATLVPPSQTDIHKAYNYMQNLELVKRVLDSFQVDGGPSDLCLQRWKTCMSFVYFYPLLDTTFETLSKERVCGLLDWLEITLLDILRFNQTEKILFCKVSQLLEALPLSYKPHVAYTILSSIFSSYRRKEKDAKIITLSNWEPADSVSCGPGAIRYMVIECGTAIRTLLQDQDEYLPAFDIGDWILHQLYTEDGERNPEWHLQLRDKSDASTRISINKERIMEFLVHKLRTHPVESLTEAKLRAFIMNQFDLKQNGMFEHDLGKRQRLRQRLRQRSRQRHSKSRKRRLKSRRH
jgi:hypothetical protein